MIKICTLLFAVAFAASVPTSSDAAKNPKGCKRTNVRPANPQGSVLIQSGRGAAAISAVPLTSVQSSPPVMVFGDAVLVGEAGTGAIGATGTVVPSITTEAAPPPKTSRTRKRARRRGRSAAIGPSSLPGPVALASASSC